jgi:hypothetical protein
MTADHDTIDELLAGYMLRALSGDDAVEADRLLTEHVPDCVTCRQTLDAFRGVVGDLGLAPRPAAPPETLLPRLQRELDGRRTRRMTNRSPAKLVFAAAAVVVTIGVGGLVVTQTGGTGSHALAQADLRQALAIAERPDARTNDLGPATEVTAPGLGETWIYGTGVASPPPGLTYRLWAIAPGGGITYVGDFAPIDGVVVLRLALDTSATIDLLVTLEPAGSNPGQPGEPAWS